MTNTETPPRSRPVGLSKRLTAIVEMSGTGTCVCDVGCDHAHVPIRLLQEKRFLRAIGMDVIEGPLGKAAGNLALYGVEDRVDLRLSNGLDAYIEGEADTLVITGMGGTLMEEILLREPVKAGSFRAMVLGPQSDPDKVRAALRQLEMTITDEKLVYEDGKYYPVIRAESLRKNADGGTTGSRTDSIRYCTDLTFDPDIPEELRHQAEDLFGPLLLKRRDPVLFEYLRRQAAVQEKILRSVSRAAGGAAGSAGVSGSAAEDMPPLVKKNTALQEKHLSKKEEIRHRLEIFRAALTVYNM